MKKRKKNKQPQKTFHCGVYEIPYKMDSTLNQIPKNGLKPIETVNEMAGMPKLIRYLYAFDLVNVGLSSTFAIGICFGIGYVVRHVAGPSAILSIMLAAFIAYFVGKIDNCYKNSLIFIILKKKI